MAEVRKRPTAKGTRYDVRYRAEGREHMKSFARKVDAEAFKTTIRADVLRGVWVDPRRGRVTVADYAARWLEGRPALARRTREMYRSMLRVHIEPELGQVALADLTPERVRRWHATVADGPSPTMAAKSYRLLRTILSTAVDDDIIARSPCRIRSAGVERPDERKVASIPQLYDLADAVGDRYRALVLLAGLGGLRWGEATALTRADVDLLHGIIRVHRQRVRLDSGETVTVAPKTAAGRRTVALPSALVEALDSHLAAWSAPGRDGLVFIGRNGAALDRGNFRQRVWVPATRAVGVDLSFHDLRHTAATLAAATGASTKELMARMGHASPRPPSGTSTPPLIGTG